MQRALTAIGGLGAVGGVAYLYREMTAPPPEPVYRDLSKRVWSRRELYDCKGNDGKPIHVALHVPATKRTCVFDVSSASWFYGPGKSYNGFAGRDASRALAMMDVKEQGTNIDDLDDEQKDKLQKWAKRFVGKYPIVGTLMDEEDDEWQPPPPSQDVPITHPTGSPQTATPASS